MWDDDDAGCWFLTLLFWLAFVLGVLLASL